MNIKLYTKKTKDNRDGYILGDINAETPFDADGKLVMVDAEGVEHRFEVTNDFDLLVVDRNEISIVVNNPRAQAFMLGAGKTKYIGHEYLVWCMARCSAFRELHGFTREAPIAHDPELSPFIWEAARREATARGVHPCTH